MRRRTREKNVNGVKCEGRKKRNSEGRGEGGNWHEETEEEKEG